LLANLHAIIDGATMNRGDVIYSWLPLFHDMGLIAGLLLGVYLDIPTFIAPPKTFMTRPESWLRAIHCFGATFSAAPNFAYHAAAHKLPDRALTGLDLSTWRLAFAGAELVEPATIEKFVSRYQSYGFRPGSLRPAYGLAECTLAVAFPRQSSAPRFDCIDREAMTRDGVAVPGQAEEPRSVTYASVGRAVPKHTVSIRDVATGAELPERRLGEVVVTGPSVTPGYFSELRAGTPEQTELRTGDLGYLLEGELFIVDRIKDVLIVAGRKYSPSDIEREVSSLEGIRSGSVVACATRGVAGTEQAFVIAALQPGASADRGELASRVASHVREHLGLGLSDVLFVRPNQIPRTSSGKLQRTACAALVASGQISGMAETPALVYR
jgi:acyl-CoA synthetase (AMP-forming)/AMP-acid ligase II